MQQHLLSWTFAAGHFVTGNRRKAGSLEMGHELGDIVSDT
jgi:hypothetical protein